MRVIFLDIDGVLNSRQSFRYNMRTYKDEIRWDNLCIYACFNLKTILEIYKDVSIVVSSTWRIGKSIESLNELLLYNNALPLRWREVNCVISKTPYLGSIRGLEIQKWLKDNSEVEDFVILDDDGDMGPYRDTDRFIQTSNATGFDYFAMEKVDKYFGGFNLRFKDLVDGRPYKMYNKDDRTEYFKIDNNLIRFEKDTQERREVYFYPETSLFAPI